MTPIRASAALRVKYEARCYALIDEMARSLLFHIKAQWRKDEPETVMMGEDASSVAGLKRIMAMLSKQWLTRFDELADSMADYFAQSIRNRCDRTLQADLHKAGFSIKFTMTPAMRDAFDAVRAENVGLIRSIGQDHLAKVETMVMQSVSQGRDLATLTRSLQKQTGITKRRASHIALDQNNKATAAMRSAREQEVGITEGVWLHSGGGKVPRESHKAFSGKRFKLAEGHDFGDGFGKVRPGEAISCRCTWRAILPIAGLN